MVKLFYITIARNTMNTKKMPNKKWHTLLMGRKTNGEAYLEPG